MSDHGPAFLSKVMCEVYQLLGVHKLNTTAYHPRTDGLVERFNRTLTNMLAKTVEQGGKDWDQRVPFVLFAYMASAQGSTQESLFFLLYGRDPLLPTDAVLEPGSTERESLDVDDYKSRLSVYMLDAWDLARANVKSAQKWLMSTYDRTARPETFQPGERVFVQMPGSKQGKAYKFARTFHGPYRVKDAINIGVLVSLIDRPNDEPIRVALDRVRHCYQQVPDQFWPPRKKTNSGTNRVVTQAPATTVWTNRLQQRPRTSPKQEWRNVMNSEL